MNQRNLLLIIVPSAIVGILTIGLIYTLWFFNYAKIRLAEEQGGLLVNRTKDLGEVKAFHDRYGEPRVWVDRTYGLDVIFAKKESEITGVPYNGTYPTEPGIHLKIRFDSDLDVKGIALWCNANGNTEFKLTEKIQEYLQKEDCFKQTQVNPS